MRIIRENALCLIVDIQERLLPHIAEKAALLDQTSLLIKGLQVLGVPLLVTQQYTKGLGQTVPEIRALFPTFAAMEKRHFSCLDDPAIAAHLQASGKTSILVAGIEAHVCIMQTVLDLKAAGYQPVIVADCVSSRSLANKDLALRRLEADGAILTSTESLLFELLRNSASPEFKDISRLVK
jgi:nicotinamidase-related amidase